MAAPSAQAQHGHAAHVHGQARLELGWDVGPAGGQLSLALEAPLESLLGFEHAPRTAAQRQAAQALLGRLRTAQGLWTLPAEADCRLAQAQVQAPVLEAAPAPGAATPDADGHAELQAQWRYDCARPAALTGLQLHLQGQFAPLRRLEVQAAVPGGQFRRVLGRQDRGELRWGR
ncbi:ZrgA family zinc uptake protein [Ideonella livida]|uniref:DUF2796 domain-containing protein n=1 Tax=Ideonella livida TaxID=2707176 RepID=A0A7C9PH33_9BURK|nr:DUF2796 domain-containing protein [Ideonella livida]NDY91753.1 DUF2796 domain-containing protein [Ideonella livida]